MHLAALLRCRVHALPSMGQRGFTLVELMVGMVLGLLVAAAAVATLLVGRQGFTSVDNSSQLRETARFAASAIELAVAEAGFQNVAYGVVGSTSVQPGLQGFTNALVSPQTAALPFGLAHNNRTGANCGAAAGTACLNNSDVLGVRYWGAGRNGTPDGSMVNCAGFAEADRSPTGGQPAYSIIHVATGSAGEVNAEPALACTYLDAATLTFKTVPIVQGVESFRVLYGTYGVTAGACAATPQNSDTLELPADTFLTAQQMDGTTGYCLNNWSRVRSLRIGLLVRGAVGSASVTGPVTWNLLGAKNDTFFNAATDAGATLQTAADGRLRQQLVFTVHLRNPQVQN